MPVVPEQVIAIAGGKGKIDILNAAGQQVTVYDLTGRRIVHQPVASGHASISIAPGVYIVKSGAVTRKVIVN